MSVSAPEGETITGYQVTEFPFEEPTTWLSQAPTTYTITGGEGITRLIAWAQSEDDVTHATHVAHFVRGIYYAQTPPVVSSLTIVPKEYGKVEVCWNTDVDTEAAVEYGKVLYSWQPEGTVSPPVGLSTTHVITVDGLDPALNYKFRILNNEFESTVAYHPLPWPTPGDSNFDCRVNILDLIAIRNKLNLSAGDDDNWKYDMNRDGRINILDLIHVRNHLNTQCP